MATLVRPTKEGGATTYQGKVALGFKDILASEVDADLDTMYAAWNGGADSVNLKDGSVTEAKLATDAHLWTISGTTIRPFDATKRVAVVGDATFASIILGSATAKGRLTSQIASGALATVSLNVNRDLANGNAQDDATKPSWGLTLREDFDYFTVQRSPAGSTTQTPLLTLDNTGFLHIQGTDSAAGLCEVTTGGGGQSAYFRGRSSRGTPSAPTATLANDIITQHTAAGYTGSAYAEQGLIRFVASENWSATARGTACVIQVTVNGATAVGGNALTFDANGNLTITGPTAVKQTGTTWANPSDPRLKQDVAPYATGLAEICQLDPITYRLKAQPDGPLCYGFDASAVKGIFPECVSTTRMKLNSDDEEETDDVLSLDMHPILVALVNAVKQLTARLDTMEAKAG